MRKLAVIRTALRCYGIRDAADYAEVLIAESLRGRRLVSRITQGHDIIARHYGRVEVKCRQLPADGRIEERVQVSPAKESGFDFLAIVIFRADFTVKVAVIVPYAGVWDLVSRQRYNRISCAQVFGIIGAVDLTQAVCVVAEQ